MFISILDYTRGEVLVFPLPSGVDADDFMYSLENDGTISGCNNCYYMTTDSLNLTIKEN